MGPGSEPFLVRRPRRRRSLRLRPHPRSARSTGARSNPRWVREHNARTPWPARHRLLQRASPAAPPATMRSRATTTTTTGGSRARKPAGTGSARFRVCTRPIATCVMRTGMRRVRVVLPRAGRDFVPKIRAFRDHLAGRPVECAERDCDRDGRIIVVLRVSGFDVNAWMPTKGGR